METTKLVLARGGVYCICVVIKHRKGGLLLGLPDGVIPKAELEVGAAGCGVLGPSTTVLVPAAAEEGNDEEPDRIEVLVLDCTTQVSKSLSYATDWDWDGSPPSLFAETEDGTLCPDPAWITTVALEALTALYQERSDA